MSTPIALWLAEKLEDPESAHGYRLVANNAADELRRLQQENEQLKAQRPWVGLTKANMQVIIEQARVVPKQAPCPDYNERLLMLTNAVLQELNT